MNDVPNYIIKAIKNFLFDIGYNDIKSIAPTDLGNSYEIYIKLNQGRGLFYSISKQKIIKYVIKEKIKVI